MTEYNIEHMQQEDLSQQVYNFASYLLFEQKIAPTGVVRELTNQGLPMDVSQSVVNNIVAEFNRSKEDGLSKSKKAMFYGFLWFLGGTILTATGIGFIFWGAIVYGAWNFFRGLYYYLKISNQYSNIS